MDEPFALICIHYVCKYLKKAGEPNIIGFPAISKKSEIRYEPKFHPEYTKKKRGSSIFDLCVYNRV